MNLLKMLQQHRLVAVVRGRDVSGSINTCLALAEGGVRLIEVSLTTADAFRVIEDVARQIGPDVVLGAGTVLSETDAIRARDSGASYLVTPALAPSLEVARAMGLPVLAGALTPSEVVAAVGRGVDAVKLFPASVFGPSYVATLRDPFPDIPLVPVGGVGLSDLDGYFQAGATAVGVGSPLCGDAPHGGNLDELRERARAFLAALP